MLFCIPEGVWRKEERSKRLIDDVDEHRYLPAIGRFLIVVTFLEDALRIITQWTDQLVYLRDFRNSMLLCLS
jgi:hypothetical protein